MNVRKLTLIFAAAVTLFAQAEITLERATRKERLEGDLKGAIELYRKAFSEAKNDRPVAAKALIRMAECYQKLGDTESRKIYEQVVREFADQSEPVAQARVRLATGKHLQGSGVVVRQTWAGSDVDTWAQPSPDGRYLVFKDMTTRNIAVRDLTSGEVRQVTRNGGNNPVISPDGKQIVYNQFFFDRTGKKPQDYSLHIVDMDGSRPRDLIHQSEAKNFFPVAWSRDGKQIVAFFGKRGDGTGQIALVSSADGSVTPLKTVGWRYPWLTSGSFSADGRFLVYSVTKTPTEPGGIYAIATDGSRETPLVEGPANDFAPVYTPDGKRVVFLSNRSGTVDLWSIRVADGRPQGSPELLRENMGKIGNFSFARDGTFFYGLENRQSDSYVADFDPRSLKVTSRPKAITDRFVGSNSRAAWSPDGKSVAFLRPAMGESRNVVIRSTSTGEERSLPAEADRKPFFRRLLWFPDNRHLLVPRLVNDRIIYFKTDTQTGKAEPILEGAYPVAALSADGNALYFSTTDDGNIPRSVRRDLESGRDTILFQEASPGPPHVISLSPDGDRITFELYPPGSKPVLMVVPSKGGEAKQVNTRGAGEVLNQPGPHYCWTPDGRHILLVREVAGAPRLWIVPVEGGEPRLLEGPIESDMENISDISFLPDGRGISFTGTRTKREIWTIRNLLTEDRASR